MSRSVSRVCAAGCGRTAEDDRKVKLILSITPSGSSSRRLDHQPHPISLFLSLPRTLSQPLDSTPRRCSHLPQESHTMALNWATLSPARQPTPLPNELTLRTIDSGVELTLFIPDAPPSGSTTSGGSGGVKKLKENGRIWLTDQRVRTSLFRATSPQRTDFQPFLPCRDPSVPPHGRRSISRIHCIPQPKRNALITVDLRLGSTRERSPLLRVTLRPPPRAPVHKV